MRLLTKEQARELDRIAIQQMGISGIDLMGKAGSAVAEYAQNMIAGIHNPKVAIICGKGNNAGDGYKAALELQKLGVSTKIFIISDKKDIQGDSLFFYEKCVKVNIALTHSIEPPIQKYDLIIDAILGTGFKGEFSSLILNFTRWINSQKSLVLSIDIPSGVDANTGNIAENAINADATVTMGLSKVGMMLEPGKSYCGDIIPVDIGFPDIYNELPGMKYRTANEDLAYKYLKAPEVNTYKHNQGKVLVVAGSRGMTGAAILASLGAMRSGAGLVTTCAPGSLNNIYETNIIEGLTLSCEDNGKGYFTEKNYNEIKKYFDWSDTILIGPGLGQHDLTKGLVEKIVKNYNKPLVIDADGLNCFAGNLELFNEIKSDCIITPHHGELARLINTNSATIINDINNCLQLFMQKYNGILVAKNAPTLIAQGNEIVINSTGNQGLATGGTGDVLSGMIASFVAQGIPTDIAAELGVFIHGKAADIIAERKGYRGLIASDLIDTLPQAIMTYE
ncbi:MAG: NAD(P)H-hydrate dehydratase [Planctomycetia bacterium]|nr:NAD(P)H-hydrate dehydratase [Planctomycetia bacterium]